MPRTDDSSDDRVTPHWLVVLVSSVMRIYWPRKSLGSFSAIVSYLTISFVANSRWTIPSWTFAACRWNLSLNLTGLVMLMILRQGEIDNATGN